MSRHAASRVGLPEQCLTFWPWPWLTSAVSTQIAAFRSWTLKSNGQTIERGVGTSSIVVCLLGVLRLGHTFTVKYIGEPGMRYPHP